MSYAIIFMKNSTSSMRMRFGKQPLLMLVTAVVVAGVFLSFSSIRRLQDETMIAEKENNSVAVVLGGEVKIPTGWGVIVDNNQGVTFGRISAILPERIELTTDVFTMGLMEGVACDRTRIIQNLAQTFPAHASPFSQVDAVVIDNREIGYTWIEPGLVEGDRNWCIPLNAWWAARISAPVVDSATIQLVEIAIIPQLVTK